MISTLHIKNIGIIEDLSVDLNEGLNILTGETGSGKTLILKALGIISGGRFSKDMIRKGENYSYVEANIFFPENKLSIDGNIVVSREIYVNGRNSCKVNGRLVTVTELKEIMSRVFDIHGQQDNQNLLDNTKHISYLDEFIGDEIKAVKNQYSTLFSRYNEIKNRLEQNYGDDKERQRELDILQYQVDEIDKANLKSEEDLELEEKHRLMRNTEKLQENLRCVDFNLNGQTIDGVSNSIKCLEKIENCGQNYANKLNELKNIYYEIQELSRDICQMQDEIYFNEDERNYVEKRIDEIHSLKRKYGNSIEEILQYSTELKERINQIENNDEINQKLKEEKEKLEKEMLILCNKMSNFRKSYGLILSNRINKELKDLEMNNAKFNVKVCRINDNTFNSNGIDKVNFMICTNTGEEEKELDKIASGGEMARVMLAIKTILSDVDKVPTLIFDEIDTGISGKAAKAVGDKMKHISEKHQIICVTHLASIAAKGNYNYYISKKVKANKTLTDIKLLNEDETISEIARIANGDITDIAIQNAKQLRKAI